MYNDVFINEYEEETYIKYLRDRNLLWGLVLAEKSRYVAEKVNGEVFLLKESLDHYVLKRLNANSNFQNTMEFRNYLDFIISISAYNYETSTNVFWSAFPEENYKRWFGKNAEILMNNKNNQNIETIFAKIRNNQIISQNELNAICIYFGKKRSYTDIKYQEEYGILMTYIFTTVLKNYNLYKFSPQLLDAIINYIPVEYGNKNGFEPYNIRLFASDYLNNKDENRKGVSHGNQVFVSRDFLKTKLNSINDSEIAYKKDGEDFTFLMIVLFHEMTHNYQRYMSKKTSTDSSGIAYSTKMILQRELQDYNDNHDNEDIEIDATQKGWILCERFFRKHFFVDVKDDKLIKFREELLKRCKNNSRYTIDRRNFAIKKDKQGNLYPKDEYDIKNLLMIINNNPDYLKEYPCLKRYFNDNGDINIDFCFNEASFFNNNYVDKSFYSYILLNYKKEILDKIKQNENRGKLGDFIYNIKETIIRDIHSYIDTYRNDDKMGEYKKMKDFELVQETLYEKIIKEFNTFSDMYILHLGELDKNKERNQFELKELKKDVSWIMFLNTYKRLLSSGNNEELLNYLEKEANAEKYYVDKYHINDLGQIQKIYQSLISTDKEVEAESKHI